MFGKVRNSDIYEMVRGIVKGGEYRRNKQQKNVE